MQDLRIPTGYFFTLLGVILIAAGLLTDAKAAMTTVNVNLMSGASMLVFGVIMLGLSRVNSGK